MTTHVTTIGIDVAKDSLSLYRIDLDQERTLQNSARSIRAWLKELPAGTALAVEATSTYHLQLADLAHQQGHRIYLIDGYRLSNYRKGIGGRVKNDASKIEALTILARKLARIAFALMKTQTLYRPKTSA